MSRRAAAVSLALLAAALAAGRAPRTFADEPPAPPAAPKGPPSPVLTVERVFGDEEKWTKPIPDLGPWRPGHDAWTFWRDEKEKGRVLVEVDAATGAKKDLFWFDVP